MPPWTRNRSEKLKEKASKQDLQVQTATEHAQQDGQQHVSKLQEDAQGSALQAPSRRNRRLRDSVVSLSAVNDSMKAERIAAAHLEVPEIPERPVKSNRFSLLKFRHASDSQLSKTAKEHAENTPPIPTCMLIGAKHTSLITNFP